MSVGKDNFADATPIVIPVEGGTYTSDLTSNETFTTEPGEPAVSASSAKSGWWKYLPVTSGLATLDTQLTTPITSTDTYMAVWTGSALDNLVLVASDDDSGGSGTSRLPNLAIDAGITYYIQLGGFGFALMNYVLRVVGPSTEAEEAAVLKESRQDNAVRRLRAAGFIGSLQDMQRAYLINQYGGSARDSVADIQLKFAALNKIYEILPDAFLPPDI